MKNSVDKEKIIARIEDIKDAVLELQKLPSAELGDF